MGTVDDPQEQEDARGWLSWVAVVTGIVLIADVLMAAYGRITLSETSGLMFNKHPWIPFGLAVVFGHIAMQREFNIIPYTWLEPVVAVLVIAAFAGAWEYYRYLSADPFTFNWWQMWLLINAGLFYGSYFFSMTPQSGSIF